MLAMASGRPLCTQTTIIASIIGSPGCSLGTFRQRITRSARSGDLALASGSTSYQSTDFSIRSLSFFLASSAPTASGASSARTCHATFTPISIRANVARPQIPIFMGLQSILLSSSRKNASPALCHNVVQHATAQIGQPLESPLVKIGERAVLQSDQIQNRGVQVAH